MSSGIENHSKVKARDVVPGWPRGRSTSRHVIPVNPDIPPMVNRWHNMLGQDITKYAEDWNDYADEQVRKEAMMKRYYEDLLLQSVATSTPVYDFLFRRFYGHD